MTPWAIFPAKRFGELASVWDGLNEACHGPPFLQSRFIRHALKHFGTGRELVAVAGTAGHELAMTVLVAESFGRWQTFQPSQLPLGAWLMRPGLDYGSLGRGLFEALPGCPLMLGVTQQDPMMFDRPASSSLVQALDYVETAWVEISGDFETYWRGRSAHLRQNMRTQRSRLEREGAVPMLEELTDPDEVAGAIGEYVRLEGSGWKAAGGTAVTAGNGQDRFYRTLMEEFCGAGQGTIYRLSIDGRAIAVDLCIVAHGTEVLLKTTYDESLRGISPSTMLKHLAWRRHFESQRVKRCEFFGPFMPWAQLWTTKRRRLFHVNLFRWAGIDLFRRQVRNWLAPAAAAGQLGISSAVASSVTPVHGTRR